MRFISLVVILVAALRAEAAMVRVVAIEDARTLVVERGGARERVRLAGIEITDDAKARELLRWTAGEAWVMLEAAEGGFLVYRSPDALMLNRELVARGYARATLPNIQPELRAPSRYLGEWNPPASSTQSRPGISEPSPRRTRSGTSRRSPGSPSRRGAPSRSNRRAAPAGR
jgi:hypothetical protein